MTSSLEPRGRVLLWRTSAHTVTVRTDSAHVSAWHSGGAPQALISLPFPSCSGFPLISSKKAHSDQSAPCCMSACFAFCGTCICRTLCTNVPLLTPISPRLCLPHKSLQLKCKLLKGKSLHFCSFLSYTYIFHSSFETK